MLTIQKRVDKFVTEQFVSAGRAPTARPSLSLPLAELREP
jgi:hypothetical protein